MKTIRIRINNYLFRIKTEREFITRLLDRFRIILSPYANAFNEHCRQIKPYIIDLYLDVLAKDPQINFKLGKRGKGKKFYATFSRNGEEFLIYTPYNSFIKTNLYRKIAEGKIAESDHLGAVLLRRWMHIYLLGARSVRLHAAFIRTKKDRVFLFAGESRAGKTTLTDMLTNMGVATDSGDDECFLFLLDKKVCLLDRKKIVNIDYSSIAYPASIFFLKRSIAKSKIVSISKKEAFKRLCFLSEFPLREDKRCKEKRPDILMQLVKQCRCYLFVNGDGLKDNPKRLKQLVLKGIGNG